MLASKPGLGCGNDGGEPMTLLPDLVMANRSALRAGFEHAIRIAMHEAVRRTAPKRRPEEPDIVAMLVLESTYYFAAMLGAVLRFGAIDCMLSSVFCHQRPEVAFHQGRCELGDLLLVHRHIARNPDHSANTALLLQVKKTHLHLLAGVTGRAFHDDPTQDGSDWSRIVHDLLGHASQHSFKRKHSGVHRFQFASLANAARRSVVLDHRVGQQAQRLVSHLIRLASANLSMCLSVALPQGKSTDRCGG